MGGLTLEVAAGSAAEAAAGEPSATVARQAGGAAADVEAPAPEGGVDDKPLAALKEGTAACFGAGVAPAAAAGAVTTDESSAAVARLAGGTAADVEAHAAEGGVDDKPLLAL